METIMIERVQKLIAASGMMSRRAAEECIAQGRVSVNGAVILLGDKADSEKDIIAVDGKVLPPQGKRLYIMLNKPKGFVTTMSDEKGRKNVSELVKAVPTRVYPVGRLDMYSEGLLLMTNDGEFANRMMHPSNQISKTYMTWVSGADIPQAIEALRLPMEIDGYLTRGAEVCADEIFSDGAVLRITIFEGRNRQIRKMCEAVRLRVTRLMRICEGGLELGTLKAGQWRFLTEEELKMLGIS